ncbi:hypothetical protein ACNOYE_06695 [Nannocystaceae bacterium ST9]
MSTPSLFLLALFALPGCLEDDESFERSAELESEAKPSLSPNCAKVSIEKCEQVDGCTVIAFGCDFPQCEFDPVTQELLFCYPCDPIPMCVPEVDCESLSYEKCLEHPQQCEIELIGCDPPPPCEIDPYSGEMICYPCDPLPVCVGI